MITGCHKNWPSAGGPLASVEFYGRSFSWSEQVRLPVYYCISLLEPVNWLGLFKNCDRGVVPETKLSEVLYILKCAWSPGSRLSTKVNCRGIIPALTFLEKKEGLAGLNGPSILFIHPFIPQRRLARPIGGI